MEFVMGVCDEVIVLDFGTLIAAGAPAQVQSDAAVIAAYLGDATDGDADVDEADRPTVSAIGGAS
jgi:branched-chain amino acid transport system ATP-binding protein